MLSKQSVYTLGAGHSPPVLAGRDELLRDRRLMLDDVDGGGRVRAQDTILAGPRGTGKTAVVTAFGEIAREQGVEVVNLQADDAHTSGAQTIATCSSPRQRLLA